LSSSTSAIVLFILFAKYSASVNVSSCAASSFGNDAKPSVGSAVDVVGGGGGEGDLFALSVMAEVEEEDGRGTEA
jgi:hypothetical protein